MSQARGGQNAGHYYSNIVMPQEVNCTFTVNATDTGGLGITSLKSNGWVRNVFMHTSATPGSNDGATNPNPAVGYAVVQFKQNFNVFLGLGGWSVQAPNSGSAVKIDNSAMTAGQVYTISTLGNATAAKWSAIGVPAGVTPAVGVSFVAASNGGSGNTLTSRVMAPAISSVADVEVVGNSILNVNSNIASNGGMYVYLQFLSATSSSVTTQVATAPVDGSIVSLSFLFDRSSVTVDGL